MQIVNQICLWFGRQGLENLLGYLTVLIVVPIGYTLWLSNEPDLTTEPSNINLALSVIFYIFYMMGFSLAYGHFKRDPKLSYRLFGVFVSFIALGVLLYLFFFSVVALLVTILVSRLPYFLSYQYSIIIGIAIPVIFVAIDYMIKGIPFYYQNMLLFIIVNVLIITSTYRFISEQKAKDRVAALFRELKATQILLSSIVKRDERLRISRDLHDTLGHQLVALNLQLEVAQHVQTNKLNAVLYQARDISTQLLSSVRETVMNMREGSHLNLMEAIQVLTENIPGVTVSTQCVGDIESLNVLQSEVIFRCIQEALTNVIKHSNASHVCIKFSVDHHVRCWISDDGRDCLPVQEGNGLKGMRERLLDLDGSLEVSSSVDSFVLYIYFPTEGS